MNTELTEDEIMLLTIRASSYYRFNKENRHYHNWDHAGRVLFEVDEDDRVKLAALWHDAIYIPGSKVNEEASADALLYEWKSLGIKANTDIVYDACALIRSTTVDWHLSKYEITNAIHAELMDADLVSLADPYIQFQENQANIILENGGDPEDFESRAKCADFLKNFLTVREYIYHTDKFRALHEEKAKQNIKRYVEENTRKT